MSAWYSGHLVFIQLTITNLLLVLSLQVTLRVGAFSMAGIGCYGIGAYTTAILLTKQGLASPIALLVGVVVAGLISYVLGAILGRLDGLYLAMATVAFDLIVSVVATNGGNLTGGALGLFGGTNDISMWVIAVGVLVIIVILDVSERGPFSRKTEAIREDVQLATAFGLQVTRARRRAFLWSGALGGLAGGLSFLLTSTIGPADISFTLLVTAFTMLMVGGVRSWRGAAIGVLLFTWLPYIFSGASKWLPIINPGIVVVVAVAVPEGIYGLLVGLTRRLRSMMHKPKPVPATVSDRAHLEPSSL